jgi:hypothetical protein
MSEHPWSFWAIICLVSALAIFIISVSCYALDTFRCGSEIVKNGDTTFEVAGKCGEPDYREITVLEVKKIKRKKKTIRRTVTITAGSDYSGVSYGDEKWYYDCGPDRFIYVLIFSGSKLIRVERGGYGAEGCLPCPSGLWSERKELFNSKK